LYDANGGVVAEKAVDGPRRISVAAPLMLSASLPGDAVGGDVSVRYFGPDGVAAEMTARFSIPLR
jgi:hypothetical protein